MSEHERRYRIGRSGEGRTSRGRTAPRRNRQEEPAPKREEKLTYSQYLSEINDSEKLFDVESDSKVERALDVLEDYFGWLKSVPEKAKRVTLAIYKKLQPYTGRAIRFVKTQGRAGLSAINGKITPLYQKLVHKFGAKNAKYGLASTAVLVLLGGLVLFGVFLGGDQAVPEEGQVAGVNEETPEPNFETIQPENDSPVLFDPSLGVASYQDQIEGKTVTISQQPLDEEAKQRREELLKEISVNLRSEVSFNTQFGVAHLASQSDDTGDQVVVFMTEELLIFIRSREFQIDPVSWISYINNIKS